jgi:polyribonucleotide nucleotidyltransferase
VVKNIVTDKKIVEACNQIREEFEQRIINLEQKMLKTCGEQDVRKIVQKEMENRINVKDKREITNHREVVKEEVIKLPNSSRIWLHASTIFLSVTIFFTTLSLQSPQNHIVSELLSISYSAGFFP